MDLYLNTDRKDLREQLDVLLHDDDINDVLYIGICLILYLVKKSRGIITQTENIRRLILKKFVV